MTKLQINTIPHAVELIEKDTKISFTYIDQLLLPDVLQVKETTSWKEVLNALKRMSIRGSSSIGIAGLSALALWIAYGFEKYNLDVVSEGIAIARSTPISLSSEVKKAAEMIVGLDQADALSILIPYIQEKQVQDEENNIRIGELGSSLLASSSRIITYGNAGALGAYSYGSALSIIYSAFEEGKIDQVYVPETRPVCEGTRLTSWELSQASIPHTILCDNMIASLMMNCHIDAVIAGADRIAKNGDVASKIGTYALALLAKHHDIPFYVAASTPTIDAQSKTGFDISIENRDSRELIKDAMPGVEILNPAYDITPASLITSFITEKGIFDSKHMW